MKMIYVWQTRDMYQDTIAWHGNTMRHPAIICIGTTYPEILPRILDIVQHHFPEAELFQRPFAETWEIKYIDVDRRYGTDSQAPLLLVVRWLYNHGWNPMSIVGNDTYYFRKQIPDASTAQTT